ncbi:MAG: cysteine-rich CWC family protein [Mobilitalea sp.]
MQANIDQDICPLCGKPNNCQHTIGMGCWCEKEYFPEELLNLIPEEKKMKACICKNCLVKYREEQKL